jgi:hypothetical protein
VVGRWEVGGYKADAWWVRNEAAVAFWAVCFWAVCTAFRVSRCEGVMRVRSASVWRMIEDEGVGWRTEVC